MLIEIIKMKQIALVHNMDTILDSSPLKAPVNTRTMDGHAQHPLLVTHRNVSNLFG